MDVSLETVTPQSASAPTPADGKTPAQFFQTPEEPFRAEMRGLRRLEETAAELAARHKLATDEKGDETLFRRFEENNRLITQTYRNLGRLVQKGVALTPSEEWLIDNYYIVAEQFREIREDLPPEFYDELPKLENAESYGVPRIYVLAADLVAHTDSLLDGESLTHFIGAYQNAGIPLTIGEIWALPIALRLVLLENLRRISISGEYVRTERENANQLAERILQSEGRELYTQTARLQKKLSADNEYSAAWLVQLIRRLRNQDEAISPILETIEKELAANRYSTEQLFVFDQTQAAASVVTTGNVITSFRWLKSFDWSGFFEKVSRVDQILRDDPAGIYARMDFETRNRYRQTIEQIARRGKKDEIDVARRALELARAASSENVENKAAENADSELRAHVGFYLLDERNRAALEREFDYRPRFLEKIQRFVANNPNSFYFSAIALISALFTGLVALLVFLHGGGLLLTALAALLALVPAVTLAVSLLNWDTTKLLAPTVLPKMDYSEGIPDDAATIVVIPTIFDSQASARETFDRLEVHYLANADKNVYFAVLTDFPDADREEAASDDEILQTANEKIAELNLRYHRSGNDEKPRFHLFQRKRLWSETERKWMGWERKRGKLEEFNRLLRGAQEKTSFVAATLEESERRSIKYVITLDADTKMPSGTARKMVGIIAHPLNQPQFFGRTIARGYAVLQPRVSITAESTAKSVFAQIMAGFTGLDPYTTAASDVYQDLFGAGIYTGKGLYVVDAFERALEKRIPPESLLSHDLFESLFARTALVSDVEFFDDYPRVYEAHAKRLHRWVRGDWQLLPWLLPRVPAANEQKTKNDLPLVGRWKILDNLRRSLIAPTAFLLLAAAWTIFPAPPLFLTLLLVFVLAFPIYAHVSNGLLEHPRGVNWENRLEGFSNELILNTLQFFLTLIFLPHQAVLMCDAIARTVYRVFVSRRNLLEWTTAAQIEKSSKLDLGASWRFMRSATFLSAALFVLIAILRPGALIVAAPFLILWAISPIFAFYINQLKLREAEPLDVRSALELRSAARQTWRFFQSFINADDNWLPPDNFQEDPQPLVARRTSPTNIGLLLLANAAGHDFGYLGLKDFLERTENTLDSIEKLEKYHGHLLNWYDTETLAPLYPKYISTVDSGNLAGHLVALKQSLLEKADAPIFSANLVEGLRDGWTEVKKHLREIQKLPLAGGKAAADAIKTEKFFVKRFLAKLEPEKAFDADWAALELSLEKLNEIISNQATEQNRDAFAKFAMWFASFREQINSVQKDADEFFAARRVNSAPKNKITALKKLPLLKSLRDLANASFETNEAALETAAEKELRAEIESARESAARALEKIRALAHRAENLALAMDFKFLLDENQKVFAIGFNVSDNRRDNSFYDLLASEARLASLWAIAKGDAPPVHWFRLGRPETMLSAGRALVSWSGSMFEYLMPLLVMRTYTGTLLDQTYRAVVERNVEYGKLTDTPWGISEAGYNARDLQLNYQYGPFGVPGLGLKRGLGVDLVVAPYATLLATMVAPGAAVKNLQNLKAHGALGNYGFYESIDYTPERLPENKNGAIVKNYMAHHQGMSLIALHNILNDNIMQRRFHRDPLIKSVELLLQERAVQAAPLVESDRDEVSPAESRRKIPVVARRVLKTPESPVPQIQMLSNRNYSVMVTNAGGGFSTAETLAVTRWREDAARDAWGSFIYLTDAEAPEKIWSAAFHPIGRKSDSYEVAFTDDRAVFRRSDFGITAQTEIIVSSDDNVEMRHVTLINETNKPREIFVTSYAEIVLNTAAADAAHPAFSNLFVETEFVESEEAILARRRPRSEKEREVFGVHVALVGRERVGSVEYETDRAKFLGRGRTTANPSAVLSGEPFSKTTGAVLDPVFSLRYRLKIPPRGKASICFSTGIAFSRGEALRLADKYNNSHVFERESAMAWTKARVEQRHLRISAPEAIAFQTVASRLLYSSADYRARNWIVRQNNRVQSNLWAYGVSGDLPILLVRVKTADDIEFVKQMLRGQEYLRLKGLKFDLVIMNLHPEGYAQNVSDALNLSVRTGGFQHWLNKPGGIFILRKNLLPEEDALLFEAIARVALDAEAGTIVEQMKRAAKPEEKAAKFTPQPETPKEYGDEDPWIPPLKSFNGLGGFTEDGREYVTVLRSGQKTPAPWLNVIANGADFGFQISESGAGYTWSVNSRENRLTTWSNDFVSDSPSEAFYLRDEETGTIWSPTPAPAGDSRKSFVVKHGQGYSQFLHNANGIAHDTLSFVPLDSSVKITILRLENRSNERRKLTLWHYAELVMGVQREKSAPSVVSAIDTTHQVLFAYNRYNNEFANRSAFLATNAKLDSYTCDRREFLGRNGSLEKPFALSRTNLLRKCDPKLDPCFATHTNLELEPNETSVIVFLLGETETDDKAREIVQRFRKIDECYRALDDVKAFWDKTLTRVEVKTPDEATDLLVNRWLLYQTLVCRVWARSAFYQSGGAFGFRDQLQDVMSLVHTNPEIVRNQILLAAARQFKEGDVQHWWHPPTGRGVRTRISDDLLWLPFVTAHYLKATGDHQILDEKLPFLEARELNDGEEDMYIVPAVSEEEANLFEHCRRAVERSLKFGEHDLPLMGSGDWNDGMNQVGLHGKGESVWLGWFLYAVLNEFAPVCDARGDSDSADKYREQAANLQKNIEENAWDGEWYRRAYFDDGTPLGSADNDECRIDAIAQSWSVISGGGSKERTVMALDAVEKHLVKRERGIILLFTPPFDRGKLEPGYIKGYVPGVRENGGQYAHGALWTVIAYALAGKADLAAELFALINPIRHARTPEDAERYKNEPYVFTADIHNTKHNVGRGGWSWYTGSAAWAYRAVTEYMFGLHKRADKLIIEPHFPRAWHESELVYRFGNTTYRFKYYFSNEAKITFDGKHLENAEIPLKDDGREHFIEVHLV